MKTNVLATLIFAGKKYVLTRGWGLLELPLEQALERSDLAVYEGTYKDTDSSIAAHGNKIYPDQAIELFSHLADGTKLEQRHFRR